MHRFAPRAPANAPVITLKGVKTSINGSPSRYIGLCIVPAVRSCYDSAVIDARQAAAYNATVAGRLWRQEDLPAPMSLAAVFPTDSVAFAHLVSVFQLSCGLTVDGKLGTDTLAALRTAPETILPPDIDEESEDDSQRSLVVPSPEPPKPVIGRSGVSNCLRVAGESISLPPEAVAAGVSASNFVDDDEHKFPAWKRRDNRPCRWFVIHESVSMSQKNTIRTLERKKARSIRKRKNGGRGYPYGVQLIVAPDGHISCHADLLEDTLTHANQLNRDSVGCEFVNPYNPKWAKPPFDRVIRAPWWCWKPENAEALYTLPTDNQLVSAEHLCRFLTRHLPDLPLSFPTANLGPGHGRIKGWAERAKPAGPGVVAHRDFTDHSDGRYILEHVIERLGRVA